MARGLPNTWSSADRDDQGVLLSSGASADFTETTSVHFRSSGKASLASYHTGLIHERKAGPLGIRQRVGGMKIQFPGMLPRILTGFDPHLSARQQVFYRTVCAVPRKVRRAYTGRPEGDW